MGAFDGQLLGFLSTVAAGVMSLPVLQSGSLKPAFTATMNEGGAAAVEVRLIISPAGRPLHCDGIFLNGPRDNLDAFCSMLRSSTQFAPAHNRLGETTYGAIYVWSEWQKGKWTGSQTPQWTAPDLTVTTNRMPDSLPEGSLLRLVLNTDVKGKIDACVGPSRVTPPVLQLLCKAAAQATNALTDESGRPVPGVQEFTVRVTSQPAIDRVIDRLRKLTTNEKKN